MKQILSVQNVCFSYYKKPLCLKDVSFSLNEKEKVILFAPEEMGKTTFLKVVSSFEDKYFGKVLYDGKDLKSLSDKEKNFSLIFAEPIFIKGTIRKNIDFLTNTIGKETIEKTELENILKLFDINETEETKIKKLSAINKLKLSLLRSYIKKPKVLFIDDIFKPFEKDEVVLLFHILKILMKDTTTIFACSEQSFKMLYEEITGAEFTSALYLNAANFYKFETIEKFLSSNTDFMSLAFKNDWQSELAIISRENDGYFLSFEDNNLYKIDKAFYAKLESLKLDISDTEEVYFVSALNYEISKLENDELNKGLQSGKFSIFATLDGTRVL